jgi:hypothetical protein
VLFDYLNEVQQDFEKLPSDVQKKWLSFIAGNLKDINFDCYQDRFIQALASSFQLLIKSLTITYNLIGRNSRT